MPLGKRTDLENAKYVGYKTAFLNEVEVEIEEITKHGFDFIVTPLISPNTPRDATRPLSAHDLAIIPNSLSNQVAGELVLDHPSIEDQINWALHCGIHAVVISLNEDSADLPRLARIINSRSASQLSNMSYWIHIKINGDGVDTWERWNQLRCLCNHNPLVVLMIELTEDLPPSNFIERLTGEPVRSVAIPTKCFVLNSKGYPALPKRHRLVVERFLSNNVQLVLCPNDEAISDLTNQFEYLSYIFRSLPALEQDQVEMKQYYDHLQVPLEPLKDNLESCTYEVFEKDAPKYLAYERAITAAIADRPYGDKGSSLILLVAGAGRGPLVNASLNAGTNCARRLHIYAIEKNPNAVVDLQVRARQWNWADRVTIINGDMRSVDVPYKADIIVSELLGSFGDNELSPECLDGAQRLLKEDGISIPASYTSYCAPITASKAYSNALAYKDKSKLESSHVVKFSNCCLISQPEPVFVFSHPNIDSSKNNSRYKKLVFKRGVGDPACLMHGLGGYFETDLYKGIGLSTVPGRHTPDMESWFSMFFPLMCPVTIPTGHAIIEVHVWRCVGVRQVWYEWAVTSPEVTGIHNTNGQAMSVGM